MPARPAKVSRSAPRAIPRRAISAIPRVINAASALSPHPSPAATPAASAMTFFSAPPNSTPITSSLVYTRKYGAIKASCTKRAVSLSSLATTFKVSKPRPTSSACEGPLITAIFACGISEAITWDILKYVPSSKPLEMLTILCPSATNGAIDFAVLRIACDGDAVTIKSAFSTQSFAMCENVIFLSSITPGKNSLFSLSCFNRCDSASCQDHSQTSFSLLAISEAIAVPQLPDPITATFMMSRLLLFAELRLGTV